MIDFRICDLDIIRILRSAFTDYNELTIHVDQNGDYLRIDGIDPARCVVSKLMLTNKRLSDDIEPSDELSIHIDYEEFREHLIGLTSKYLSNDILLALQFDKNIINFKVQGRRQKIQFSKSLDGISGISKLPPLTSFDDEAFCELSDPKLLRFVWLDSRKKTDTLRMSIGKNELVFRSIRNIKSSPNEYKLPGITNLQAGSHIGLYQLNVVSKISSIETIINSTIHIIDDGMMKFSHKFKGGKIDYYVTEKLLG